MTEEPVRLLEGTELAGDGRALLEVGRAEAPVQYDAVAGEARFRATLAGLVAASAIVTPAATGSGKTLLGKLSLKALIGLLAGASMFGAGAVILTRLTRTPTFIESRSAAPHPTRGAELPLALPTTMSVEQLAPAAAPERPAAQEPHEARTAGSKVRATHVVRGERRRGELARAQASARTGGMADDGRETSEAAPGLSAARVSAAGWVEDPPSAPPAPPPASPKPALPGAVGAQAGGELQAMARAQALVERDPETALEILDDVARNHPNGYFVEERRALTVMALLRTGRRALAREQAATFLRLYPNGPFSDAVRTAASGL